MSDSRVSQRRVSGAWGGVIGARGLRCGVVTALRGGRFVMTCGNLIASRGGAVCDDAVGGRERFSWRARRASAMTHDSRGDNQKAAVMIEW